VVLINAGWGLGENVVRGTIGPDQYLVFKPLLDRASLTPIIEKTLGGKEKKLVYASDRTGGPREASKATRNVSTTKLERASFVLSDAEVLTLARCGCAIEAHYGQPMDVEWAKDGDTGHLYVVQARPETVQSRREGAALKTYTLKRKGRELLTGVSVGGAIATGKVRKLHAAADRRTFEDGAILVTEMTDPDWLPIMKRAAAIVTDRGGRTSHAAIVSREIGLPASSGPSRQPGS
jgi:pyruvate, water dikinase